MVGRRGFDRIIVRGWNCQVECFFSPSLFFFSLFFFKKIES